MNAVVDSRRVDADNDEAGKAWHVDSLDRRAGIAFASLRHPALRHAIAIDEALAIRVAPPDFEPETLASNATAFAATRAGFQWGLYSNESTEVAFPSVEALVEFVRRLYLRGGGGDFPPGGGEPPRGPDGGPPLDDAGPAQPRSTAIDGVADLLFASKEFMKRSQELVSSRSPAKPFDAWCGDDADPVANANVRLARAGLSLLWTSLQRAPGTANKSAWTLWLVGAVPLARCFDRMQIWPLLLKHFGWQLEHLCARSLKGLHPHLPLHMHPMLSDRGICALLLRQLLLTGSVSDALMRFGGLNFAAASFPSMTIDTPYDDLDRISIPRAAAKGLCTEGREGEATLRHVVTSLLGSPQAGSEGDASIREHRFELLFFSAAYLCSPTLSARQPDLPSELAFDDGAGVVGFAEELSNHLASESAAWLSRNLPQWVFRPVVETMIETAL